MAHGGWGSRRYVDALTAELRGRLNVELRSASPVPTVEPALGGGHAVCAAGRERESFDEIVFACHADDALAMMISPTASEREILSAFEFRDNDAVLHGDASFMPKARAAWASWIFTANDDTSQGDITVTYWMNCLQDLPGPPLLVTLNPDRLISERVIFDRHTFRHPVLSRAAVAAQARLPEISGVPWFVVCRCVDAVGLP